MKLTLSILCIATFLFSCDPNETSRVKNPNLFQESHTPKDGGAAYVSNSTDVPFDGGLGALLLAGAAVGAKRVQQQRTKAKK